MNADQQIWWKWTKSLQQMGIAEWVASLLEIAGPLTLVAAQVVYFSQPIIDLIMPQWHPDSLARMLEDKSNVSIFVSHLREDTLL